jgi:hypothetical protein
MKGGISMFVCKYILEDYVYMPEDNVHLTLTSFDSKSMNLDWRASYSGNGNNAIPGT